MGGTSANRLTGLSGGIDGDTMGVAGGLESHTLTIAQLPAHDHGTNTGNQSAQHDHGVSGTTGGTSGNHSHAENANSTVGPNIGVQWWSNSTTNTNTVNITAVGSPGHTHNFSTTSDASTTNHTHVISSQGSGTAHNIVQPTMILNKIIYTGV
jgi:microcystin-dependent protein